jgi:aminomethyltransferase
MLNNSDSNPKSKTMKNTPLVKKHEALGAKMAEFAGYNMPISYAGIKVEHNTVREGVGVFDVSHMGEFMVEGDGALDLIQKVTTNDASKLSIGDAQYSCFPNGKGGIVDDLLVYRLGEKSYLLVVNASNIDKDWNWINEQNTFGAALSNISDNYALLAVQGPKAAEALQSLTDVDLSAIKYYTFKQGTFAGLDNIILSATGYTGSGGFELYVPNEAAEAVWDAVFEAGKDFGIAPIGLGARDTLRLEMGYCLYGNDIDDTTSPLEAGLGWITKLKKGDFIDSDYLNNQKAEGTARRLVGFEMVERGIPRHDYLIEDAEGNVIGKVTSGTQSPSLGKAIGLGYVSQSFAKSGSEIYIAIRNKKIKAEVVKLPFYKG